MAAGGQRLSFARVRETVPGMRPSIPTGLARMSVIDRAFQMSKYRRLVILAMIASSATHICARGESVKPANSGRILAINVLSDGSAAVAGWACQDGNLEPPRLHMYVGDPYPIGQIVTSTTVSARSPKIDCGTGKGAHGFVLKVSPEIIFRYGGMPVFIYSLSHAHGGSPQLVASKGAALPAYLPVAESPRDCEIADITSLKRCFDAPSSFDQFSLERDISCASASDCCGANNAPLMHLESISHRTIEGNGHVIHRGPGALACKAISINNSSDILINNITFDEGKDIPPCELIVKDCPSTIDVNESQRVRIDDTHIYFGKGYVVHVWGTNGFVYVNSSLSDSGIIGLYVGHYKYAPSKNVVIADSVIAHSRTNGVAIQGASGTNSSNPVLVMNNIFVGNHWHGLWPVPGVPHGITSGGQVLVGDAANIRLTGNIVGNGVCGNCNPVGQQVSGIEIGDDTQLRPGVFNIQLDHNYLYSDHGTAFYQNPGTRVSELTIESNRIAGNVALDTLSGHTLRDRNDIELQLSSPSDDAAFILGLAPILGAATSPIFRCKRDGAIVFASTRTCDGNGDVLAVLGFSYESSNPLARPVFSCLLAKYGSDQFLSIDSKCEGGLRVAQLGFAIPK